MRAPSRREPEGTGPQVPEAVIAPEALLPGANPNPNPSGEPDTEILPAVYVVAPGRTLQGEQGSIGTGSRVDLADFELEWLVSAGFVVPAESSGETGGGVSVGGLKVIGGRRPGGVVR